MSLSTKCLSPLLLVGLFACTPAPPAVVAAEPEPLLAAEVFFAPLSGQSPGQQERDRYECHLWAKKASGFDPSLPQLAPHQRTVIVPAPEPVPGEGTVFGAIAGAVVGAIVSPRHSGEGALIGALAGGTLGAVSDANRQQQNAAAAARYARQPDGAQINLDRQAQNYRRALAACLEGRGYSVR